MTDWSLDTPAPGLAIAQPRRGFRYGAEAFWLAGFALEPGVPAAVADLGTGSGVVAALCAWAGARATGFDARSEWAPGWDRTLAGCAVDGRLALVLRDVGAGLPGRYPLIVSNPPFFPADTGPASPDPWRRAARTETTATLRGFVAAAFAALSEGGRACFVVPAARADELAGIAADLGGGVGRRVQVGRVRALLELWPSPPPEAPPGEAHGADHPRVRGWTDRFARAA